MYDDWSSSLSYEHRWIIDRHMSDIYNLHSQWGGIYHDLVPFFEGALKKKKVTAWVCSNDVIALMALDFLKKNNVAVPARISVTGFHDTSDTLLNNLTTYNFGLASAARESLSFLRTYSSMPKRKRRLPIDIAGSVISRSSVSRREADFSKA
jgi:DNA-binding LacI/PurR family transcriptional regulator